MKITQKHWIGIGFGLAMIGGAFFVLGENLFYLILVFGILSIIAPFIIELMITGGKHRKKQERFLEFVRDLVENVKSGTPISKSIVNLKTRDYGVLSEHVVKLSSQVSMGIPLQKALRIFANDTRNKVIIRAVSLIAEAERSGGDIDTILESVATSVSQIETLRKEQKAAVSNLVVQGYIIFIVFIVIMIVIQFKILPMTSELGNVESLSFKVKPMSAEDFQAPLLVLILVQSFFAGFVIGKISEGSLKAGIKHSFILLALTLVIVAVANVWLG